MEQLINLILSEVNMEGNELREGRPVELLKSFWNVQKNMMQLIQKTAVNHGLSVPQYVILVTIAPYGEMFQKTVVEKTFLPKSTLSQAVEGLVSKGFIERHHVEGNRREVELLLSEEGKRFLKELHVQKSGIHDVFQQAADVLTEKEYEGILRTHNEISALLERKIVE
jgi:DNA-binding MarR family transcriptional regulator